MPHRLIALTCAGWIASCQGDSVALVAGQSVALAQDVAGAPAPDPGMFSNPVIHPGFVISWGDLQPDGAMRYYGPLDAPTVGVQIDVMNVGQNPVVATSGRVSIEYVDLYPQQTFDTALYQYFGGTATDPNTLNPGERGYLKVEVPAYLMSTCAHYRVHIDLDHTMQSGADDLYDNDERAVLAYETGHACTLTWTTPINGATLGAEPTNPIDGKSLHDIVSNLVIGRADGFYCSHCHYAGGGKPYSLDVAQDTTSTLIDPYGPIAGGTWGPSGAPTTWTTPFLAQPDSIKPAGIKAAFAKWVQDGSSR